MTEENIMSAQSWLKGFVTKYQLNTILAYLKNVPDQKLMLLQSMSLKSPLACTIIALFFGWLGFDRFAVGDGGLGVLKFLTLGGCFIWAFIDLFLIGDRAKEKNYQEILRIIS